MKERIRAATPDLVVQRGRIKSLCPSEMADALSKGWRA